MKAPEAGVAGLTPRENPDQRDLPYRIARLLVMAVSVFGEADYAMQWLKEPNEALGGAVPLQLLATIEGVEIVRAELGAIEHGLPA
jgi:putative toxin-antitoxin system antitoxin component (TIGR02293 family)